MVQVPPLKLDKALTREIIVNVSPQYVELLRELQSKGGWVRLPEKFDALFRRLNFDNYVLLFDDEKSINICFVLFLMGQQGLKEFNADLETMTPEQQAEFAQEFIKELLDEKDWEWMDDIFPNTPEKEAEALARFQALDDDKKAESTKRAIYFWGFFFGWFYQYLALMLHGQKLTVLVAQAKAGNEDAFCKAIHIEPRLLKSHPFFRERYEQARENQETEFLKRIGYRLANPGAPGKIRYPGLYVVFAILDAAGWLDGGFNHEELLDICDEAGLDRYQNRIEDTNYLTKRLIEYRKTQKSG